MKLYFILIIAMCFMTSCIHNTPSNMTEHRQPASQLSVDDIKGLGTYFIKVTENENKDSLKFELCKLINPNECSRIGKKNYYLKSDLKNVRRDLRIKTTGDYLTGSVMTLTGVGSFILILAAAPESGGTSLIGLGGATTLTAAGVMYINKGYSYAQKAKLVSNDVLSDKPVYFKEDATVIAKKIESLLEELN